MPTMPASPFSHIALCFPVKISIDDFPLHLDLRAYQPRPIFSSHVYVCMCACPLLILITTPHAPKKGCVHVPSLISAPGTAYQGTPVHTRPARPARPTTPAAHEPSRGMDSGLLSYKGTAYFSPLRLFAPNPLFPSMHRFYPNCPNCPSSVSSMRRTREITWRIGAVVARVRVPISSKAQGQLSRKFDAARFCILRITIEYRDALFCPPKVRQCTGADLPTKATVCNRQHENSALHSS
ncbi:hypothetical protein AOQ84DRAFT_31518 [Glonium stellatum]|uniref:Uncharacterized protein n=1 Tax=Glonium stellatum TaxID=574774 RepID=A0A8E2F1W0_9PEZI|nr:hypothetical protein AOQ84DRAFT_31518 [Glonium stellatum]